MKECLIALMCFGLTSGLYGQADLSSLKINTAEAVKYGNTIKVEDLKRHLFKIASDEFEGRETGTEGQRKAAEYIANHFATLGLPKVGENDSYMQKIAFISETWDNIRMEINEEGLKHLWDYYSYPSTNGDIATKKSMKWFF